ncbi:MAG TPA: D-aminoacylase [Chryseosolibacter sp.]
MRYFALLLFLTFPIVAFLPAPQETYDIILRGGMVYDGSGSDGFVGDVALQSDTIAALGNLTDAKGRIEIDARGLIVAPGFINMLSWSEKTLLMDGRSMSDIKQGVTTEIFGEGFSPGPVKRKLTKPVDSLWTTLDGYFKYLIKKGISPNVGSFVGATTIRMHELEQANRAPTPVELKRMQALVAQAMREGALGLGSSLIYAPANYAKTEELIALCKVVSAHGGMYITHMRSEGDFILPAINETIRIAKEADVPAEIYHLKINLERNWNKIDTVISKIDSARQAGIKLTANMYPYSASGTGLTSRLPTWLLEGGAREMRKRLRNASVRKRVLFEMEKGIPYKNSDPSSVMLMGFRLDSLNALYKGKKLSEAAKIHGKSADETTLDLIIKDKSPIEAIYYLQSEANVRKIAQLPYVSFGSDAGSMATSEKFEKWGAHPRAYGTFARILGRYVRDEKIITLEDAIRRLTSLPASNLKIQKRGRLMKGYFADVVVFDLNAIKDHATFENPHQYASGMHHVFINGVHVLANGEHTQAMPGRIVRGPGYTP